MVRTVCLKNFDFASQTDKGKVRVKNEDFVAYFDTFNGHVFIVCDGMGGHKSGNIASELAVESIGKYFNNNYYANPFEAVEGAMIYANNIVHEKSTSDSELRGMGTTMVLILIREDRVYYGHAGDSRLYYLKNNELVQMTSDHSHVQMLLNQGQITKKQIKNHPKRNQITKAIGLASNFEPEISPKAIIPEDDDILLLCSDGLTSMASDKDIQQILEAPIDLNSKASKLISKANKRGGDDNISVQIIKFHNINIEEDYNEENKHLLLQAKDFFKQKKLLYFSTLLIILISSFLLGLHESTHVVKKNKSGLNTKNKTIVIAYKIKKYDSFNRLSEKFNITKETIQKLNPNIDTLIKGAHIKIPVKGVYTVSNEDELPIIIHKYNSNRIDILKANDLGSVNLKVGSSLYIPLSNIKENIE